MAPVCFQIRAASCCLCAFLAISILVLQGCGTDGTNEGGFAPSCRPKGNHLRERSTDGCAANLTDQLDVQQVHPCQFEVAVAFGDSITSGFSATGLLEQRWLSFSGGEGTDTQPTLPYLLRTRAGTPPLKGASGSEGLFGGAQIPRAEANPWDSEETPASRPHRNLNKLNLAIPGATSNRWKEQMTYLEQNYHTFACEGPREGTGWRLVSVFFGSNDVLLTHANLSIEEVQVEVVQNFEKNIYDLLEALRQFFGSRVYVNLMGLFDISTVARLQDQHFFYKALRDHTSLGMNMMKPFVIETTREERDSQLVAIHKVVQGINEALKRVAAKTDKPKEGFGVNLVTRAMNQPIVEKALLSPFDSLHPSALGHRVMAIQLFNSMFERSDPQHSDDVNIAPVQISNATKLVTYKEKEVVPKEGASLDTMKN